MLGPPGSALGGVPARGVRRRTPRVAATRRATSATCCCRFCTRCRRASAGSASRALGYVCERLTIPPAEAYGVATFYALFALEPRPPRVAARLHRHRVHVPRQRGARRALEQRSARPGSRRADGTTTWLDSPCLGLCEQAPAALVTMAGEDSSEHAIGGGHAWMTSPPRWPGRLRAARPRAPAGRRAAGCSAGSATSTRRASTTIARRRLRRAAARVRARARQV